MVNREQFPVFSVGTIFQKFKIPLEESITPKYNCIEVDYPVRLNGMSIDSSKIALDNQTSFPAGEICFSISEFVHAKVKKIKKGILITADTKRKSIVAHACLLMCKALSIEPSFEIRVVCDDSIQKHSGFGSSGAIIGAVCVAINELYGNPIDKVDLMQYMASNYGEEIDDINESELQLVQCIGGSVGNGLFEGAIKVIAGQAIPIFTQDYDARILVATPKDYHPMSAKDLMKLEEENFDKFTLHGEKYSYKVAYDLIHDALPKLKVRDISGICSLIYRHRFEMGSINNCSFIYPKMIEISSELKLLYEKNYCELVSISSVGPVIFAILDNDKKHEQVCLHFLNKLNLNVFHTCLFNESYKIKRYKEVQI